MPLSVGDEVVVRALARKRGTVIAVGRDGRYRVRVDGITMWCREAELGEPPPAGKKKKRPAATDRSEAAVARADTAPPGRIDLHGLRVEEAMTRVMDAIDRSLREGADRIEVVHGKGSGRIRDALHRRLASLSVVSHFALDAKNDGVTWVYF
jgi:DNA mismatch repair protein MutS2